MRTLTLLLIMVSLSLYSYSQSNTVFRFHVSSIFQYSHLNVISTHSAIEHGYVKLDTLSITNADYLFDFDSMRVTILNYNGAKAKRDLLEYSLIDNSFKTYFIDSPYDLMIEVIYHNGILSFKWIEVINNMEYAKGWISKVN